MVRLCKDDRSAWRHRGVISSVAVLSSLVLAVAAASAQSSNPDELRRIIAQKNAEAAAATWAGHPGYPNSPFSPPGSNPNDPSAAGATEPGRSSTGGSQQSAGAGGAGSLDGNDRVSSTAARAGSAGSVQTITASTPLSSVESSGPSAAGEPSGEQPGEALEAASVAQPASGTRRAVVLYNRGVLSIHADNSSLHDILRQISKLTGMRIVGNLPEEQVFGDQGPAAPGAVISALLDGTDSNRLLRLNGRACVTELILTPRAGGTGNAVPGTDLDDSGSSAGTAKPGMRRP